MTNCEILFHGKRTDNGEWIEGSLIVCEKSKMLIGKSKSVAFVPRGSTTFCSNACFNIDPKTVGRFIGLTDRNGTKIFEDHIIKWRDNAELSVSGQIAEICFGRYRDADSCFDDTYSLGFYLKLSNKEKTCASICWLDRYKDDFDIVGNVYDNPELLCGDKANIRKRNRSHIQKNKVGE